MAKPFMKILPETLATAGRCFDGNDYQFGWHTMNLLVLQFWCVSHGPLILRCQKPVINRLSLQM
jgi:hypothetical protein